MNKNAFQMYCRFLVFAALAAGVFLRLWQINTDQFLFYDEGMYLGYNRKFLDLVAANFPKDIGEFFVILGVMLKTALTTAKALWFFLLNLRVFILGEDAFYFARVVSAVAGILTIALTYVFARRYFNCPSTALLSAAFLSLLPSHVFYSRLGMQESFSTLLFILALYTYVFRRARWWGMIAVAVLLAAVFLTNYRMIIAPVFLLAIEVFDAFKDRKPFQWKPLIVTFGLFVGIVFFVGSLYNGVNRHVTFGWMMYQAKDAQGQRALVNFLSYPYYVFALEGVAFALLFWGNLNLILRKQWGKLLPFLLVLLQMGIFSMAAEKGARYLTVVLPMMAIAAAVAAKHLIDSCPFLKRYIYALVVVASLMMVFESLGIARARTDYQKAVQLVLRNDPQAAMLSTQATVEQLYVKNEERVRELPKNIAELVEFYKEGYRYLIIDPQVYVSWTKNTARFDPPLLDFLETIRREVKPLAVLDHLNPVLMRRFVLDHNQNLLNSITFLRASGKEGYGQIRIYDLGLCLILLKQKALVEAAPVL